VLIYSNGVALLHRVILAASSSIGNGGCLSSLSRKAIVHQAARRRLKLLGSHEGNHDFCSLSACIAHRTFRDFSNAMSQYTYTSASVWFLVSCCWPSSGLGLPWVESTLSTSIMNTSICSDALRELPRAGVDLQQRSCATTPCNSCCFFFNWQWGVFELIIS